MQGSVFYVEYSSDSSSTNGVNEKNDKQEMNAVKEMVLLRVLHSIENVNDSIGFWSQT